MKTTCPEITELLDHMEGRIDLGAHVVACEPCSSTLGELRGSLAAESALVATAPLDVERALGAVRDQARKNVTARWRTSGFFSAAAAVTLALLLPGKLVPATAGPEGGTNSSTSIVSTPPYGVDGGDNVTHYVPEGVTKLLNGNTAPATSTAAVHS